MESIASPFFAKNYTSVRQRYIYSMVFSHGSKNSNKSGIITTTCHVRVVKIWHFTTPFSINTIQQSEKVGKILFYSYNHTIISEIYHYTHDKITTTCRSIIHVCTGPLRILYSSVFIFSQSNHIITAFPICSTLGFVWKFAWDSFPTTHNIYAYYFGEGKQDPITAPVNGSTHGRSLFVVYNSNSIFVWRTIFDHRSSWKNPPYSNNVFCPPNMVENFQSALDGEPVCRFSLDITSWKSQVKNRTLSCKEVKRWKEKIIFSVGDVLFGFG